MKTVHIDASNSYDVHIGSGLLSHTGEYITQVCNAGKIAIISDSNVFPLLSETLCKSLTDSGFQVISHVFPAGEESKNSKTLFDILNTLAEQEFTRSDLLIALGGGVTGDITGFAAAIYLRGISYIQIPTSLLAMVDSSVGGKTAIDLPAGKNLVGAFYQPKMVLCDLDALQTLPQEVFCDGCAEIIKYGILYDVILFTHLSDKGLNFDREYVIPRCIELKRDVVRADEFDNNERQKLNLGHTIGHGIEKQSNYTISHGKSVAAGMAIVAKSAWKTGFCNETVYDKICHILNCFQLPIHTQYNALQLYGSALSDKKRSGGTINLIVPVAIGNCIISPTPTEQLQSFIEAGL